jgi:glycosyltransferase involved in cell wall biosynthesis
MLSVIIATQDSERLLLPTLAALIPGATEGLISEVIVADAGSRDDTAFVADVAGCNFMEIEAALGERLKKAAAAARAPWLLFLQPGVILDSAWIGETRRFVERRSPGPKEATREAAVFRRGVPARARWREVWELVVAALGAPPLPDQGLLIAHPFYDALGGHRGGAPDTEAELIRRIGRHNVVTLGATAVRLDT